MKDKIVVCDFDGTITELDSLFVFLVHYADKKWLEVERLWREGKIGSQECLTKQFDLVPKMSDKMIDEFINSVKLDPYFKQFNEIRLKNDVDLLIVSDGIDYFINRILQKNGIDNIKIISNHAEIEDGKFKITYPNQYTACKGKAGTCKCKVINDLKQNYKEIFYVGDGNSDMCVADKVDYLFAKSNLLSYCSKVSINCIGYTNFSEVIKYDRLGFNF